MCLLTLNRRYRLDTPLSNPPVPLLQSAGLQQISLPMLTEQFYEYYSIEHRICLHSYKIKSDV